MHQSLKLAVDDVHEGVILIIDRATGAPKVELPGLVLALKCLLASEETDIATLLADLPYRQRDHEEIQPVTTDPHEGVDLILRLVGHAQDDQMPGLAAALESLLSIEETPAATLIAKVRSERGRFTKRVLAAMRPHRRRSGL